MHDDNPDVARFELDLAVIVKCIGGRRGRKRTSARERIDLIMSVLVKSLGIWE